MYSYGRKDPFHLFLYIMLSLVSLDILYLSLEVFSILGDAFGKFLKASKQEAKVGMQKYWLRLNK